MKNFHYSNPVQIWFGRGVLSKLSELLPTRSRILMIYGGGSIKHNGIHAQILEAGQGHDIQEFGGIEPNPRYETCMKAIQLCRKERINFLLAVGGGSVLDATKFIAAGVPYLGGEPWEILSAAGEVSSALPLGCVLTLPATGSEMNCGAVISRESTQEKLYFSSNLVYPRFSLLDPQATFSLPPRQTANGIVDAFVHVLEQYVTYPANAPLQDRQAEAILSTLIEQAPKLQANPQDYDARANIMWCATQALNGLIGAGVPQDWSTHDIGHEITALYGLDHAQTLAILWPGVARNQFTQKLQKLALYGRRVWGLQGEDSVVAEDAIRKTENFFATVGCPVRFQDYRLKAKDVADSVVNRFRERGLRGLGESKAVTSEEVYKIILARA
ncbi:MAG TPA: iron-containing alcohol dehydrogenase [Fibrobacteraceae bacterium]|nr:iron-containing alcohol dehydrogenase [Fibrobacteraceae bacterium]